MVKLGVLSDTHGMLRPEVFPFFEGVDHILHAGDVGDPDILVALEAVAPVTAVWGNTDGFPLRDRLEESVRLEFGSTSVALTHGHTLGTITPQRLADWFPGIDIVIYGHTHEPRSDQIGNQTILNPGSCGPRRFQLPVSVATVAIDESGIRPEIHLLPVD